MFDLRLLIDNHLLLRSNEPVFVSSPAAAAAKFLSGRKPDKDPFESPAMSTLSSPRMSTTLFSPLELEATMFAPQSPPPTSTSPKLSATLFSPDDLEATMFATSPNNRISPRVVVKRVLSDGVCWLSTLQFLSQKIALFPGDEGQESDVSEIGYSSRLVPRPGLECAAATIPSHPHGPSRDHILRSASSIV